MVILAALLLLVGCVYLAMGRQDQPPEWVPHSQRWAAHGRNATIIGLVLEGMGVAALLVQGVAVPVGANGVFSTTLPLQQGMNTIVVESFTSM